MSRKLVKYAMGGTFKSYQSSADEKDKKKKQKQIKKAKKSYEKWNDRITGEKSGGVSASSKKGQRWLKKRKEASDTLKKLKGK